MVTTGTAGPYNTAINNGQSAETPQVQAKVKYAHDWWGKAAYYGKPTPFTARLWPAGSAMSCGPVKLLVRLTPSAPWGTPLFPMSRPLIRQGMWVFRPVPSTCRTQYVNPWLVMGSLFIPVIPTHSANLAGTASILTQWWIGEGVEAFGFAGVNSNLFNINNNKFNTAGTQVYDVHLLKKFGGMVEGQYYFTNQWFFNAVYGVSKAYNVSRARFLQAPAGNTALSGINAMEWAMGDNAQTIQQVSATLWYRPIQAIKFGLQYSYAAATYFAYALPTTSNAGVPAGLGAANTVNRSHFGDDHRVEFVGFFYF